MAHKASGQQERDSRVAARVVLAARCRARVERCVERSERGRHSEGDGNVSILEGDAKRLDCKRDVMDAVSRRVITYSDRFAIRFSIRRVNIETDNNITSERIQITMQLHR